MLGFAAMRGRGLMKIPTYLSFGMVSLVNRGTGELVEAWREEFNEPEIIDSKDILSHLKDPDQFDTFLWDSPKF